MKRCAAAKTILPVGSVILTLLQTPSAQACSVCMGDPAAPTAEATNAAIFLMLGCIGGVLGLLSAFGIYLYRRSLSPMPPHAEFNDDFQPQNG